MNVFYDYQCFIQDYGGVSRYFTELLCHLDSKINPVYPFIFSNNQYIDQLNWPYLRFFDGIRVKGKKDIMRNLNKVFSGIALRTKNYDVAHITYYHPYFFKYLNAPIVVTIHDMSHEWYPDLFNKNDPTSKWKKEVAIKADHIIAVSENTKKDIIQFFNIDPQKITVIHHGYSKKNEMYHSMSLKLPDKFLLYVGRRDYYKNVQILYHAFPDIKKKSPGLKLVCLGGGPFSSIESKLLKELGIEQDVLQVNVHEKHIPEVYRRASMLVFPSLNEGFGFPVLEAFAVDCPVVLAKASSLPEIGGDAAIYFSPWERDELVSQILYLLFDQEKVNELKVKGRQQLNYFSWQKTARKTEAVYDSLL